MGGDAFAAWVETEAGQAALASLPEGVFEAVESLLQFARATFDYDLSVQDLAAGLRLAVADQDSHNTLMITLKLAEIAQQLVCEPGEG